MILTAPSAPGSFGALQPQPRLLLKLLHLVARLTLCAAALDPLDQAGAGGGRALDSTYPAAG
jgi:hypothetical protein